MSKLYELIDKLNKADKMGNIEEIIGLEHEIIDVAHLEKPKVHIYYNDDAGKFQWSVLIDKTDFWIDSFLTKDDAVDFCEEQEFEILTINWDGL